MILFSSIFLSTIGCFENSLNKRVFTFVQLFNLVYHIFNFGMYSFVNITANDVIKAVLDEIIIPALGLTIDRAEVVIFEALPKEISVINKNNFFFSKIYVSFIIIIVTFERI